MENLKLQYRDLEQRTLANLRYKISVSREYSRHSPTRCIKVSIFNYTELVVINNKLTFLDANGMQYSLWNGDCSLEDLIDVLNVI